MEHWLEWKKWLNESTMKDDSNDLITPWVINHLIHAYILWRFKHHCLGHIFQESLANMSKTKQTLYHGAISRSFGCQEWGEKIVHCLDISAVINLGLTLHQENSCLWVISPPPFDPSTPTPANQNKNLMPIHDTKCEKFQPTGMRKHTSLVAGMFKSIWKPYYRSYKH